jgi:hypothetical protein
MPSFHTALETDDSEGFAVPAAPTPTQRRNPTPPRRVQAPPAEPPTTPPFTETQLPKLPPTFKEALELLKQCEALPGTTRAEQRAKAAILAHVKKHVFTLQQGVPAAPYVDANAEASNRVARAKKYDERESRIAALKKLLGR